MSNQLVQFNSYGFLVKKIVSLPVIGDFYVMQSPFGSNHLMPVNTYKTYNIKIGDKLLCYVDKINCAGTIFLEPEHPYYERGKIYDIKILEIGKTYYKRGKYRFNLIIEDYRKNRVEAIPYNYDDKFEVNKTIKLRVVRLNKGKLVLSKML